MILSSSTITLFAETYESRRDPFSLALSVIAHGVVSGLIGYVLIHSPQVQTVGLNDRYSVRLLEMRTAKPVPVPSDKSILDPSSIYPARPFSGAAMRNVQLRMAVQGAQPSQVLRVLTQTDVPSKLLLPLDVAIPLVVLVSPVNLPAQKIAPQLKEPTHSDVQPVLVLPNREPAVAEIAVSSMPLSNKSLISVTPSTTSPLRSRGSEDETDIPQTSVLSSGPGAPATVIALSDVRMNEGIIVVPRAIQTPSSPPPGDAVLGHAQEAHSSSGTELGVAGLGDGTGQAIGIRRVQLPRDGKFGMVAVGNSLEEQYPETAGTWTGRIAYTVYLHVGLAKSWILQYALPPSELASGTGSGARLEAPWPTDILVPNLPPGFTNSDALIAHGFLNKEGRFEKLAVAFPPQFAQARFVLDLLQRWVFRPAKQNGQITDIEVLLIIPEQD